MLDFYFLWLKAHDRFYKSNNDRLVVVILEQLNCNDNQVWDKTLEDRPEKFFVKLDLSILNELEEKKSLLNNENPADFPLFTTKIKQLKDQILLDGCGFFIIDGSSFKNFVTSEKKSLCVIVSIILGDLLKQNKKGELIVEIKDLGKSMKTGARYHQTREGGSYHTDGSHIYSNPPDYVGLSCINPAKNGGESKFMSGYTIHQSIQSRKDLLEILYQRFHHDKRGENNVGEPPTQFEPIFQSNNGKLRFRYQRELIENGHKKVNQPLSEKQNNALHFLNKILDNDDNAITCTLKSGDMMFSNNNWLIHGRTSFEDFEDEGLKRKLFRAWIREREN